MLSEITGWNVVCSVCSSLKLLRTKPKKESYVCHSCSVIISNRTRFISEKTRKLESIKALGNKSRVGQKLSEEHKRRISQTRLKLGLGVSPEARVKISEKAKLRPSGFKGKILSESARRAISLAQKSLWSNPEYATKQIKLTRCRYKPNKKELLLESVLNKEFPGEWQYTGDGKLVILGKCPDFANTNGKKALIELYGNYWHRNEDPQERINEFASMGYSCLVIWESELYNLDCVVSSVRNMFYLRGSS